MILEPPYFKNMEEMYGLKPDEYELVLSKLYNQPLLVLLSNSVYDNIQEIKISMVKDSDGYWHKTERNDADGYETYD